MADTVKELFNKKFTASEINSGTTYSITTDANTAYVIKDIQANQSATSPTKVTATASIGLTSDFSATPSKFMGLGTVASGGVNGASGSEIMDTSSTFSIRVPAQAISYSDLLHHQVSFQTTTNVTEVESITPSVSGVEESALTPSPNTQTQFGSNFTGANMGSNRSGQYRVFVTNPHTNVNLAIAVINDQNSTQQAIVSGYGNTTNYGTLSNSYRVQEWDGRFLYSVNTTSRLQLYDTQGAASRAPTSNPHTFIDLKNQDGTTINISTTGSTYPKADISYFSDTKTRNYLIQPATGSGIYWFELPNYTGADPLALDAVNGTYPATTKYYQINNSSNYNNASNAGPNGNRATIGNIEGSYAGNNASNKFYLGTSASSTTKRILFMQNGTTTRTSNILLFAIADTEYLSTDNINDQSKVAYSASVADLTAEFGWIGTTGLGWNNFNARIAGIQCSNWKTMTGSNAEWGVESHFWLDQDVLYFTNLQPAGTGEGPIIAWNLKTNAVTAPITWAQYVDSGGTALNNPGGADPNIGHRSVVSTPTSSQIASRTYTKEPSLQVRVTAVKESR